MDFYCPSEKLAVELDGQVHFSFIASDYDIERDLVLKDLGVKVLRFENKEVFQDLDSVLQVICSCFSK